MATLEEYLNKLENSEAPGFSDKPWYNAEGDCIIYNFREANDYADRIDGILTAFRDQDTREIVGIMIKGISHLIKEGHDHSFLFNEPPISLLIMMSFQATNDDETASPDREKSYQDILTNVPNRLERVSLSQVS